METNQKCPDGSTPIAACDSQFPNCEECTKRLGERLEQVGKRRQNLVSVADLKEHDTGKVAVIRGDHKVLRRLLDMGLTPDTSIRVLRVAPLEGPVEIWIRGSKLALGREIASEVFVEVTGNDQGHGRDV